MPVAGSWHTTWLRWRTTVWVLLMPHALMLPFIGALTNIYLMEELGATTVATQAPPQRTPTTTGFAGVCLKDSLYRQTLGWWSLRNTGCLLWGHP